MTNEDIDKLSLLARLAIPEEEKEEFLMQFTSVLGYVDRIQSVVVPEDLHEQPLVRNILRADENPHENGAFTEVILAEAPDRDDNYFKVPRVL